MGQNDKKINEDKLTEAHCDSPPTCINDRKKGISEDWLSLWLGLFIILLSLGDFGGIDQLFQLPDHGRCLRYSLQR